MCVEVIVRYITVVFFETQCCNENTNLTREMAGELVRQRYCRSCRWSACVLVAPHLRERVDSLVLRVERAEYLDEQQTESVDVHLVVVVRRLLQRPIRKTNEEIVDSRLRPRCASELGESDTSDSSVLLMLP